MRKTDFLNYKAVVLWIVMPSLADTGDKSWHPAVSLSSYSQTGPVFAVIFPDRIRVYRHIHRHDPCLPSYSKTGSVFVVIFPDRTRVCRRIPRQDPCLSSYFPDRTCYEYLLIYINLNVLVLCSIARSNDLAQGLVFEHSENSACISRALT
jgi:hypothetical protein